MADPPSPVQAPGPLPAALLPMVPTRYRVVDRREEVAETVTLTLQPVDPPLAPGRPGQFTMLWAFGIGEVPISIARWHDDGRIEHTIRAVGATSGALCAAAPGDMVGVRGPFGRGFDLDAATGGDLVVVGGGVGLAPLRPVVLEAMAERGRFERVCVLVGGRSPDLVLYPGEHDAWRGAGLEVDVTVDSAPSGWTGAVGVVTRLIGRAVTDPARTTAIVCGPEVMMRFAVHELLDRGVPAGSVQVSLERNMHCAVELCGRCQLGPHFVCHDGPVFTWPEVAGLLGVRER